jgi:5'-nucleotidase
MARPMGLLRIMFSSRVLLDLEEADTIFREKGKQAYTDYLRCRGEYQKDYDPEVGGRRLKKGPLFDVAMALQKLNQSSKESLVELGLSCKDETGSALPIFRNLDVAGLGLPIEYRVATAGKKLTKEFHEAFSTDLLLTRSAEDAQTAVDLGIAAAVINFPPEGTYDYDQNSNGPVRLFVDGDAVAFGSGAEVRYRTEGLDAYRRLENQDFDQPLDPGPFTAVLAKISQLNERFADGQKPFEIALLTARGSLAAARAITITESLGLKFNGGMFFMGGASKHEVLKAQRPHLFLDDQMTHLKEGAKYCPTGLVAYASGSPMDIYLREQKKLEDAKANATDVTAKPETPEAPPAPDAKKAPKGPKPPEQG